VSILLRKLGEAGQDKERAAGYLRDISQRGSLADDQERSDCLKIVFSIPWGESVCTALLPGELAPVFRLVVIPELTALGAAEAIGRWSLKAPPAMLGALLVAAGPPDDELRQYVVGLLEPFLALRLAGEANILDYWDSDRAWRLAGEFRHESKGGFLNRFRRR
jgi:hypothetical protein